MLWWLISPSRSCSLSHTHKKTTHSASFIGITVYYSSGQQLTYIQAGRKNWTESLNHFTSVSLTKRGKKKMASSIWSLRYVDKSVFIVLVEWPAILSLKHDSLKNLYLKCFWSCSFLKTLLAVSKSPSNSKQRQGTFQVSRGAASPALSLILTGKIAEWALLAFSFHFPLLLSPSLFPKLLKIPQFSSAPKS